MYPDALNNDLGWKLQFYLSGGGASSATLDDLLRHQLDARRLFETPARHSTLNIQIWIGQGSTLDARHMSNPGAPCYVTLHPITYTTLHSATVRHATLCATQCYAARGEVNLARSQVNLPDPNDSVIIAQSSQTCRIQGKPAECQ